MKKVIGILVGLGLGGCATLSGERCNNGVCTKAISPLRIQRCVLTEAPQKADLPAYWNKTPTYEMSAKLRGKEVLIVCYEESRLEEDE